MVFASHYKAHVHIYIIDHDCKIVGCNPTRFDNYKVTAKVGAVYVDSSFDQVVPVNFLRFFYSETN